MANKEQNYFKVKLQISIDNLAMAKSKLEHLDLQLRVLGERFEYNKKIYEDQIIHMQDVEKEMLKRIPALEKKIDQGYTHIDQKTGKAYKGFNDIHIGRLQDKKDKVEENLKAFEKREAEKLALLKKKKSKLKPEELQIVNAEEIRGSLQPEDEIETIKEQQHERMAEKIKRYEREIHELRAEKEEPVIEEPDPIEPNMETILEEKKDIANQMREVANDMNGETKELEWLLVYHQDWLKQFEEEEGGKAVWQGRITNGFKAWCEAKSYKIGE